MAGLKLMLLSYWGLDDVLTQAAVLPHIKLLQQVASISQVILVTIEREKPVKSGTGSLSGFPRVKHYMLQNKECRSNILEKINDFLHFPLELRRIVMTERVDAMLASGALAGTLAYKVWQKTNTPFYVIYEPHAAYMLDNKIWHRYDFRYIFQRRWENEQIERASGLILVSEKYRQLLSGSRTRFSEKIVTARNSVNPNLFRFSSSDRKRIRCQLGIHPEAVTGIYVGKYGDLYYKKEAFSIYKKCFQIIPEFKLIILTPQPQQDIYLQLQKKQIIPSKVHIASVPHEQVPQYLAAADFAFATIKSYPSARYCSPVKIGEYWASGLPVLLTEGVGDDSSIIRQEGGGALFDLSQDGSLEQAIVRIQEILKDPSHRQEIPKLAQKYRSPEKIKEAYDYFFGKEEQGL